MLNNIQPHPNTVPLTRPAPFNGLNNQQIVFGPYIQPEDRIRLYSATEFEKFVAEWAFGWLQHQYYQVDRCGGAGDMGRDVIAYLTSPISQSEWENYQCKHYDHPLAPSDIWLELGKLCYHTFNQEFSIPSKYQFVSPLGVGPSLHRLLTNPDELKTGLIQNWDTKCRFAIQQGAEISLDKALSDYIDAFDFSIIAYKPILELISEHRKTVYHAPRFGGGLTQMPPPPPSPPASIAQNETRYVTQLLQAYAEHTAVSTFTLDHLPKNRKLRSHFNRARETFYRADSLQQFSRDALPDGITFEQLQDQVYSGVIDVAEEQYEDGYKRVCEVTKTAALLQLGAHVLVPHLEIEDRHGICHQLANEDRISWATVRDLGECEDATNPL